MPTYVPDDQLVLFFGISEMNALIIGIEFQMRLDVDSFAVPHGIATGNVSCLLSSRLVKNTLAFPALIDWTVT